MPYPAWKYIENYKGIDLYKVKLFTKSRIYLQINGKTIDSIDYKNNSEILKNKKEAIEKAKENIEKYGYHE